MSESRKVELAARYGPDVAELYELGARVCRDRGHAEFDALDIGGYECFRCTRCQETWVPMGAAL